MRSYRLFKSYPLRLESSLQFQPHLLFSLSVYYLGLAGILFVLSNDDSTDRPVVPANHFASNRAHLSSPVHSSYDCYFPKTEAVGVVTVDRVKREAWSRSYAADAAAAPPDLISMTFNRLREPVLQRRNSVCERGKLLSQCNRPF